MQTAGGAFVESCRNLDALRVLSRWKQDFVSGRGLDRVLKKSVITSFDGHSFKVRRPNFLFSPPGGGVDEPRLSSF
jgi:hypothetical protein